MRSELVGDEIRRMIADVGLPHKRTALAKDLSGNLKRCVVFSRERNSRCLLEFEN